MINIPNQWRKQGGSGRGHEHDLLVGFKQQVTLCLHLRLTCTSDEGSSGRDGRRSASSNQTMLQNLSILLNSKLLKYLPVGSCEFACNQQISKCSGVLICSQETFTSVNINMRFELNMMNLPGHCNMSITTASHLKSTMNYFSPNQLFVF